jgi:NAD(P)-dependent dehydrogenase (short-subunit alcohol dehydrogenase family)
MPTIAIVGAGPGMGLSIARLFGAQGFDVALIARNAERLAGLTKQLTDAGIQAAGFSADVMDSASLVSAFDRVRARFDEVDVLEYSPAPHSPVPGIASVGPVELTVADLQPQIEYYLYGAVTAAQQVLPSMLAAGSGTLLFTTGGGSIEPNSAMGNVNAAAAALRNWAINLHHTLAARGVYAAHVAISAWIGSGPPAAEADAIATTYWDLYMTRDRAEQHYSA